MGLNQTEFGEIGGVSKTTQGLYESGERSPNTDYLQQIAAEGADIVYILTGERGTPASETFEPSACSDKLPKHKARRMLTPFYTDDQVTLTDMKDYFWLVARTIEQSLVESGAIPGEDYKLLDLYQLAGPFVLDKHKQEPLEILTGQTGQRHDLNADGD